jgi:hypothetical protein
MWIFLFQHMAVQVSACITWSCMKCLQLDYFGFAAASEPLVQYDTERHYSLVTGKLVSLLLYAIQSNTHCITQI